MNFDELKEFLSRDITPSQLSEILDDTMFSLVTLYGHTNDESVSNTQLSEYYYFLKNLRDIFSRMQKKQVYTHLTRGICLCQ